MKKILVIALALLCFLSTAVGCGKEEAAADDGVVEITEKMFVAQINDIYINPDEYVGKTVRYEGILNAAHDLRDGQDHIFVYRNGPGCCSYDGTPGFEIFWPEQRPPLPDNNAWVEVTGTVVEEEIDGYPYIKIQVSDFREMMQRGAETVTN